MAKKALFITKIPLPLTAISLGRLVTTPHNPHQNFYDPHQRLPTLPSPVQDCSNILDVSRIIEKTFGTKLEFALTSFASLFFKVQSSNARELSACRATRYFILNVEDWFDSICQEKTVRLWLERQDLQRRTVYLVTEYLTLSEPSLTTKTGFEASAGGSVQPPVMAAAGVPLPTPLDVSLSPEVLGSVLHKESYRIEDEKLFGVICQRVRLTKSKGGLQTYQVSEKRKWVEVCSTKDASLDISEIAADLEDVDLPADSDYLETDEEFVLFDESVL